MDIDDIINRMQASGVPIPVLAYVALHHQSGCRISDLLAVDFRSISRSLNISIIQGKGSSALIIQPYMFREFWKSVYLNKLTPMAIYNRFFFYRLYRKFGIVYNKENKQNSFVTHAFRKNLADDVYSIDRNKARVQGALGHKSSKSTDHYTDN